MAFTNDDLKLYHFTSEEFRDWWDHMNPRLLICLDIWRDMRDKPIYISGNEWALGRDTDENADSQHNVLMWGDVRAADVFPSGLTTRKDAQKAITLAQRSGFTGIGLYPHWNGGVGMHVDVRYDREPRNGAMWGAVNVPDGYDDDGNEIYRQEYVPIEEALNELPEE